MGAFQGKVAVVTGASRGIGRAIALRLAADGAFVVVHYAHHEQAAAATVREIAARGSRAFAVQADFTQPGAVPALFAEVDRGLEGELGSRRFDILVNNAGISRGGGFEETTETDFAEMVAVNMHAPFFVIQQALSRLADGGRIINISSGTSRVAMPEEPAYAMTKRALDSLTMAAAKHLAPRAITVNTIGPGIIDTDFQADWLSDPQARQFAASVAALGRLGTPEDIADVAAFLASDAARFITGAYIDASGGSLLG